MSCPSFTTLPSATMMATIWPVIFAATSALRWATT
jgi:hypothetical protein